MSIDDFKSSEIGLKKWKCVVIWNDSGKFLDLRVKIRQLLTYEIPVVYHFWVNRSFYRNKDNF